MWSRNHGMASLFSKSYTSSRFFFGGGGLADKGNLRKPLPLNMWLVKSFYGLDIWVSKNSQYTHCEDVI